MCRHRPTHTPSSFAISRHVSTGRRVARQISRRPYLLVGWLWYLGMLLPVIGLVQVGMQARADRYMYLPLVGLCIAVAWGAADVARGPRARAALAVAATAAVLASVDVVRTLSPRHYRSGLAEVVKTAVVGDADLFHLLEERSADVLARDCDVLEEIIARCCRVKGDIVAADERDLGSREVLNFGHTLGHALEEATGFRGRTHGEAVAVGMAWAADLSTVLGHCALAEARRVLCERLFH